MRCNLYVCFHAFYVLFKAVAGSSAECTDLNGRVITQDMHYVPGPDSCTLCICDNGHPKWCKAVLCSPPQNCKSFTVGKSCCEFICLDDTLNKGDGIADFGTDLLRLIVSAIAAILSLCLLFFLIHRLRQRKIRGRQNRQLSEDERSLASIGYITGSLGYLPQNYFSNGGPERHLEFRYEEPPSHLSLWKPSGNYFPRGEAPPPYEEAVSQPRNEVTISTSNTLPNMSHRTIPINLTTTGTIRLLNPSTAPSSLRNNESVCSSQNNLENGSRSQSNSNIVQALDPSRVSLLENPNVFRHSVVNRNANAIKNDENPLNRTDYNSNTVIRNTVPIPRNTVKQINPTNIVNLRQNLEIDKKLTSFNPGANIHADINLNTSSDASTLRYEININSSSHLNDENLCTLRKEGNKVYNSNCNNASEAPRSGKSNSDNNKNNESKEGENSESKSTVPPSGRVFINSDHSAIGSNVLYEDVIGSIPPPISLSENNTLQKLGEESKESATKENEQEEDNEEALDISIASDFPPPPLLDDNSLTEPDVDNELSSCDCLCYQYLTNNDDNDDYRSECENCKSGHSSSYYLDEESHEPPETMTLQRVPKEADEFENQEQYYRTSLTLPTHCRKPRILQPSSGARENWFSSMPESGSSSEEE